MAAYSDGEMEGKMNVGLFSCGLLVALKNGGGGAIVLYTNVGLMVWYIWGNISIYLHVVTLINCLMC